MTLDQQIELLVAAGATRVHAKRLAPNDNSKNQIYLGPGFTAAGVLTSREARADASNATFKARLDFDWVTDEGVISTAPDAQLILYPQYPEVRLGSILRGATEAPAALLSSRTPNRVLLLGVRADGRILARLAAPGDPAEAEFRRRESTFSKTGVFVELPLPETGDPTDDLLTRLAKTHRKGWIASRRLDASGGSRPCDAPNCGGYTLEAELGIWPNGRAIPDFRGWEVKQYDVRDAEEPRSKTPITLMTPEPTGGVYADDGVEEFVRRFGYEDKKGRPGRRNFGGIHIANHEHPTTGLTLHLSGYDAARRSMGPSGGLELRDPRGTIAARWDAVSMMNHWARKHAQAAYVPSQRRDAPRREYRFGSRVSLGRGTEFGLLLAAFDSGAVYYDPGIKVESTGRGTKVKRRNQFRIRFTSLRRLYERFESVECDRMRPPADASASSE